MCIYIINKICLGPYELSPLIWSRSWNMNLKTEALGDIQTYTCAGGEDWRAQRLTATILLKVNRMAHSLGLSPGNTVGLGPLRCHKVLTGLKIQKHIKNIWWAHMFYGRQRWTGTRELWKNYLVFLAFLLLCSWQQENGKEHFPGFYLELWVPFRQQWFSQGGLEQINKQSQKRRSRNGWVPRWEMREALVLGSWWSGIG